jgi:hypothetical protein
LTPPEQEDNSNGLEERTIKTESRKPLDNNINNNNNNNNNNTESF